MRKTVQSARSAKKMNVYIQMQPSTVAIIDEMRGYVSRSATIEAMLMDYLGLPEDATVGYHITPPRGTEV